MAFHQENFLSVRQVYPGVSTQRRSRLEVTPPASSVELDYRELLSEANLNHFHREHTIALQNYFALRQKIVEQSHPELPRVPGMGRSWAFEWAGVRMDRVLELSRRIAGTTSPGERMHSRLGDASPIRVGEFEADAHLRPWATLGVDVRQIAADPKARDRARELVAASKFDEAVTQYSAAAEAALAAGDVELAADITNESAVMLASYVPGAARAAALQQSLATVQQAEKLYARAGNAEAQKMMQANGGAIAAELAALATAPQPAGARAATIGPTKATTTTKLTKVPPRPGTTTTTTTIPRPTTTTTGAPAPATGPATTGTVGASGTIGTVGTTGTIGTVGTTATLGTRLNLPAAGTTLQRETARIDRVQIMLPAAQTQQALVLRDATGWQTATTALGERAATVTTARTLGMFRPEGTQLLSLAQADFGQQARAQLYEPRVKATTLEKLRFYEEVEVNFVAYYVHLYYFVLPVAIGDTYAAMGQYEKAITEYRSVLAYPFLNVGIEGRFLWLKVAQAAVQAGNALFRRGLRAAAATQYERILAADGSVPAATPLYQGSAFAPLVAEVGEVAKQMRGEAHAAFNPRVGALVMQVALRQRYLAQGLDFLGLSPDHAPMLRFKYLQSVATYLADNAIEAERTFIGYRSNAESQKMEHMQLESTVEINKAALAIEHKRMQDAQLEAEAARRTREYAQLRRDNANEALEEWDTSGRELTSMNAALSWAGSAANDQEIRYTGVRYDGERHDYEGTVEDFFDTVGEKREWLDWEMQRNRLERQAAEVAAEVGLSAVREAQAQVRLQVQALNVQMQQLRVEAAEEVLDYASERMFDEDLWFQLAGQLQDLARDYLDAAIYAARVMEHAYALEFDRHLNRIRLDYGMGGPAGLLGGDMLKRDVTSFTSDYLEHAQKKNPVRLALSLREEFPSGFAAFVQSGVLPFRTDLELFDRRYPGTCRRKLKKIEIFVEGLVPLEGASGFLTCHGICSEWRNSAAGWAKLQRVMPVERMVLSSYQFRRDIAVFQPSEELLGLFENNAPQSDWTLSIPRSSNNIDFNSIADIKFVVYFDADVDDALAAHVKAHYPTTGGRSTVLSARFHVPDEYFRLDVERRIRFGVARSAFAFHHESPTLSAFGVRLLDKAGSGMAGALLRITRASDGVAIDVTTDATGTAMGDAATMAPFDAWQGASAIDSWDVALGDGVDSATVGDLQLIYSYRFDYRAD